jgi:hypothetical protein
MTNDDVAGAEVLTFLHISDIHFNARYGESPYDLNLEIRNELEREVRRLVGDHGPLTAVLVGGDVAYAGDEREYETAIEWLKKLCELGGCPEEAVWVVPGNHDVDRAVIKSSPTLQMYHRELRTTPVGAELDDRLHELVRDPLADEMLLRPLTNYNEFAARYECDVSRDRPFWEAEWPLGSELRLRIRGVTSPLISDESDDENENRLVLGRMQAQMIREEGVVNAVLCHHPSGWLRDEEVVQTAFDALTTLQLYGHVHVFSVSDDARVLRIGAGALQPERGEDRWDPRFNLLRIRFEEADKVAVDLYPRRWDDTDHVFVTDEEHEGTIILSIAERPAPVELVPSDEEEPLEVELQPAPSDGGRVTPHRQLVYRFSSLPWTRRLAIAQELDLVTEDDRNLSSVELARRVLSRAGELNRLDRLWDAVSATYDDSGPNPFRPLED